MSSRHERRLAKAARAAALIVAEARVTEAGSPIAHRVHCWKTTRQDCESVEKPLRRHGLVVCYLKLRQSDCDPDSYNLFLDTDRAASLEVRHGRIKRRAASVGFFAGAGERSQ
jgi:hypothetical protein